MGRRLSGKIVIATHNAGKLREMLCGITAVADDALEDMSIHTGSLLVERMAVAGS